MELQSLRPSVYETSWIIRRVIHPDWESASVFVTLNLQGSAARRAAPSKAVPRDLPSRGALSVTPRICWLSGHVCDTHLSPSHALSQPGVVSQLGLSLDPWSSLQGCPKGVEISSSFASQQHNKLSSIKLGHQALFIIWKLQTRPTLMCEPTMRTCCYDNNMRLNHPDRQDTHNCVITCSCLFKGNFISAAEGTLVNKA